MFKRTQVHRALIGLVIVVPLLFFAIDVMRAYAAPATNAVVGPPCTQTEFDNALAIVQSAPSGTMTFNCGSSATITFTYIHPINNNVNVIIDGGTLGAITLSGGNSTGLFQVSFGGALTLQNITLANASSNQQGAIQSFGSLTLNNCVMTNNRATGANGGAIDDSGTMTVTNCALSNNRTTSTGNGGAIFIEGGATALINATTIFSNSTEVNGAGIYNSGQFSMNGGDITSNRTFSNTSGLWLGGGLYNSNGATANLIGVTVQGNNAGGGGGIDNVDGTVILRGTTVIGNSSGVTGGGIINAGNSGILNIYNSQILSNTSGTGGGIYQSSSTSGASTVISQTRVSGNIAGFAGGIRNFSGSFFSIYQSLIDNNKAIVTGGTAKGGGVANRGLVYAENTTFSGNIADDNLGSSEGGAIVSEQNSQITLVNVTISANQANNGGALCTIGTGGTSCGTGGGDAASDLKNTILANSRDPDTNLLNDNCAIVAMLDNFGNIDSTTSCLFASSLTGTNPQLDSLANNGGPTMSYMPLAGSLAINGGTNTGCPAVDQRGFARPRMVSNPCDNGSIEVGPTLYLPLILK